MIINFYEFLKIIQLFVFHKIKEFTGTQHSKMFYHSMI